MAERIRLVVVTPERTFLEAECDEVVLTGRDGEFGVLPGHAAMIAELRPGVVKTRSGGEIVQAALGGGFCEISRDVVTVLVDNAWSSSEIVRDEVETLLEEAQLALERAATKELQRCQDAVSEAQARLQLVH